MLTRLLTLRQTLKEFGRRHRIAIFSLALIGFIIGLIFTGASLNLSLDTIVSLPLLLVLCVTQPLLIFLNSLELKLCGQAVQVKLSLAESIFVSCSATLANILPLPGGLIVRGGALTQRGAALGRVSKVLLAAALMWAAVALTVSGAVLVQGSGAVLIAIGGLTFIIALMAYVSRMSDVRTAVGFLVVRSLMVALLAVQLKLCFAALNSTITLRGASVYVVSGIAGAVVSVVPAGLGITETFGALLAKLDEASPALAFIVLSLNRFIGLTLATVSIMIFGTLYRPEHKP